MWLIGRRIYNLRLPGISRSNVHPQSSPQTTQTNQQHRHLGQKHGRRNSPPLRPEMPQNKIHQRHNSRQPFFLPKETCSGIDNEENGSPQDINPANPVFHKNQDQGEDQGGHCLG